MSKVNTIDVTKALPGYYLPYAQYVNTTRALPDARDCFKTGTRFILYAQYLNKLTYDKPSRKAVATVNAGMEFSVHGDSSILGTAVRLSQPFSLRYPLVDVKGNNGSQIFGSDSFSAGRYLEMKSNKLASEMTSLLSKETIEEWEWNYTQEKQYPIVLPSLFPNFVNGCTGIGVGMACSIPQFNLREVCASAIKLLHNQDSTFEELYCPIDFATGGVIINETETKKSLINGNGKAAIVRAKIEYDASNRELVVVELPYQVTSSGVVGQIQKCIDDAKLTGVEAVFDGSDIDGVKICIKLMKSASPERVLKLLYKETSLQYHYGINMMMLQDGKFPRIYTFIEMLNEYLKHIQLVLRRSFEYDLRQALDRLEILEGYVIALQNLDEVLGIIRNSSTKDIALSLLISKLNLSERQAKAVLDLKLQRLVNLEILKIQKEYDELKEKVKYLEFILSDNTEFVKKVESEIKRISDEYGDDRKTTNISLGVSVEDEIIEEKNLIVYLSNFGNLYVDETTTLVTQKKGGKGSKVKLEKGEVILKTITGKNTSSLLIFTNIGKAYSLQFDTLVDNLNVHSLLDFAPNEQIVEVTSSEKAEYILFITKCGLIKKSKTSLYTLTRKGITAIKVLEDDLIVKVLFVNEQKVALLTHKGLFKVIESSPITATGRVSQGVIAIGLNEDDSVVDAHVVTDKTTEILSITNEGLCARVPLDEFTVSGRPAKGKTLQKGNLVGFVLLEALDKEIIIIASQNTIKIPISTIALNNRGVVGTRAINLKDNKIIGVLK